MMNVQCDRNNIYRYVVSRRNLDLLLNGLGDLMTKHTRGKTKALLSCLLTSPVSNEQAQGRATLATADEHPVRDCLQKAGHTLEPDGMHLMELADDMLSLLQSSLKSCGAQESFPMNGKNEML